MDPREKASIDNNTKLLILIAEGSVKKEVVILANELKKFDNSRSKWGNFSKRKFAPKSQMAGKFDDLVAPDESNELL